MPITEQFPLNPFENESVLDAGIPPQATVILPGAVIVAAAAGFTVIILVTGANALPQLSVPVQVWVTVPPHAFGMLEKVDGLEVPLIKQLPLNPFVKASVLAAGSPPHSTVIFAGAVITGSAAGLTVIVLVAVIVLP